MEYRDIEELLRQDAPATDPAARERAQLRLRAKIEAEVVRLDDRRRGRRRVVIPAAAAALVALVLSVQALLPPGNGGPTLSAAAEVRRLGALSETQPTLALGPSEYLFRRIEELGLVARGTVGAGSYSLLVRTSVDTWLALDGSGEVDTTYLDVSFSSDADHAAWVEAGEPEIPVVGDVTRDRYGAGGLTVFPVGELPSDPDRLKAVLLNGSVMDVAPGDASLLSEIGMLLSQQTLPADVRRALFEVAAGIPGVAVDQKATDPLGRSAVRVSVTDPSGRTDLFFDPGDGSLLATGRSHPGTDGSSPAEDWQAFTTGGVVQGVGRVPAT